MDITKWLYTNPIGRCVLKSLVKPKWSVLMGKIMDSPLSALFINYFIKSNNIDMSDYKIKKWKSFNDFFTRDVIPSRRVINKGKNNLISPCDGLLTVYNTDEKFRIKGYNYTLYELLKDSDLAEEFKDGICLVYRLTPANYHRYCYLDNGYKGRNIFIQGVLHTVQPIGLENAKVFKLNSREYTLMHTENFGDVVQMEVGALFVGRINNNHNNYTFSRGEEKGRFEFGGSTIVVLLKKNTVKIKDEILNSNDEYPVKMGQVVGYKM